MKEWVGVSREEVKSSFNRLTPKTEENKISYRDSDPIPTSSSCAVISCYPYMRKRIDCRYTFEFREDRVIRATRLGNCREDHSER